MRRRLDSRHTILDMYGMVAAYDEVYVYSMGRG